MTILLTDGTEGLFDVIGKAVHALDVLNTARLTTVPTEVQDFLDQYKLKSNPTSLMDSAFSAVPGALQGWQSGGSALTSQLRATCQQFLIEVVNADTILPSKDLTTALNALLVDMAAQDAYVDNNVVTLTLTADAGNSATDLIIAYTMKRGDGRNQENALAEDITAEVTDATAQTVRFRGQLAIGDSLSQDWPLGSGCDISVSATDAASSLLPNGDFQDVSADNTDVPDGWIVGAGIPGTDILLTVPEEQTVIISGTPTEGQYWLRWINPDGIDRATVALTFDASGSAVQAALRAIPGLEAVDVVTTGSSPNYTHTITFTGVAGNINQLTSLNGFDTGSLAHATTVAGTNNSYKGVALGIVGDGATQPALYLSLSGLLPETNYVVHFRVKKTGTPAAGVIRFAVVSEIGGAPTADAQAGDNDVAYDLTGALTTSFVSHFFTVRLTKAQTQPVYLEILTTSAISAGTSVYIDEMAMVVMRELYTGGPSVAVFSGKAPPLVGDKWNLSVANGREGSWQTAFDRLFDMRSKQLLLPIAGSLHLLDSLIG